MPRPDAESSETSPTTSAGDADSCPYMDEKTALLQQFGKRYTNEIIHELIHDPDPLRFGELQERLAASPDTLSTRLEELTETGLISRRSYDEIPPRVEYEATPELQDFSPMYDILSEWVEDHE